MRFAGPRSRWLTPLVVLGLIAKSHAAQGVSPAPVRRQLWHDPGAIASLDLSWKDRRVFRRPAPPFTFVKEDFSGTRAKVRVKDAAGVEWNVKLAGDRDDTAEVHAEVAAVRLTWALGYFVEDGYYIEDGTIDGVKDLRRAARGVTPDGHFRAARFKPHRSDTTGEQWSFRHNPFSGTRELAGLEILMTMLDNWDVVPQNTAVVEARGPDGTRELHYLISDLGATFGKMADLRFPISLFTMHSWSNWDVAGYEKQRFIDGVSDGGLRLHYRGERAVGPVPIEDARWFAHLVSQLTPQQVRTAFEQAGATPDEVEGFSRRFLEKVRELESAVQG